MGAEYLVDVRYFKPSDIACDDKLSARMGRGREALTAMLAGKLLDGGGQLYTELCFLEMLLCEWTDEVRVIEVGREEKAHVKRPWWMRGTWRRGA